MHRGEPSVFTGRLAGRSPLSKLYSAQRGARHAPSRMQPAWRQAELQAERCLFNPTHRRAADGDKPHTVGFAMLKANRQVRTKLCLQLGKERSGEQKRPGPPGHPVFLTTATSGAAAGQCRWSRLSRHLPKAGRWRGAWLPLKRGICRTWASIPQANCEF